MNVSAATRNFPNKGGVRISATAVDELARGPREAKEVEEQEPIRPSCLLGRVAV